LRGAGSLAGAIALAFLIWFLGPNMAFGTARPLQAVWLRVTLILAILLVAGGMAGYRYYKKRQAAKELATGLADTEETGNDAAVLREKMKDALTTLRQSRGKGGDYLYDLPWYILIGPPGSGKTTALVNSGLKFPLARSGNAAFIEGVGGTRYCDWWFTEDAVLIDTAGRYTTQDSDEKGDRKSWLAFLDLLKKNRARQPINGVILAISLEDLVTLQPAELQAHADAIRTRLIELHDRLQVDYPVYALFTKADLIAGFMEYFGDLREAERRVVWGATFQTDDKTLNMIGAVPAEFDALIGRLNEGLSDRLQEEPNHTARVLLFGFPTQMMGLKRPLVQFLSSIFEPTRYHANAMLRGFYFTSGTQQGTPIDQLIGLMARTFEVQRTPVSAYSGVGKSFFLTDLLQKVIIGEAGWVSTNRYAQRWAWAGKAALYTLLLLVAVGCVAAWSVSFVENRGLIGSTARAVQDYRLKTGPLLQQSRVADQDLGRVLQLLLHPLRHMPAGYAYRDQPVPLKARFGLSQHERLESASQVAYGRVLERTFRSRLILRLEKEMQKRIDDAAYVYEALKVYLMVGGAAKSDDQLILAWFRRDWEENLYPGSGNASGRQALEEHLAALLELDAGQRTAIQLHGPLVRDAQRTLARMSVAERAYALLKSQARTGGYDDWVVSERGGPDLPAVFEAASGEDLEQLRVPGFYTYAGFHKGFLAQLATVARKVESEQWVLGEAGQQSTVTTQYQTLPRDLLVLYSRDFIAAWESVLTKLRLRPMAADKPRYAALAAAAGEISPLKLLLQSMRQETELTRPLAESGPAGEPAPTVTSAEAALEPAQPTLDSGAQFGLKESDPPGTPIESYFTKLHSLVEGEPGTQMIDLVANELGAIRDNLVIAAVSPAQAQQANAMLPTQITNLRTNATRLASPVAEMIMAAADDIEAEVTGTTIAQLAQSFESQITQACQQVIADRYPFVRSDRDVPLPDFARLFAPEGLFDRFFKENLAPLADTSGPQWSWRPGSPLASGLSGATLRQFQRAAEIRDAFFPTGGTTPVVSFTVTPMTISGSAESAVLKVNATTVESQPGVSMATPVEWPGGSADNHAAIALRSGFFGQVSILERRGPWALYRLLDAGSILRRGDGFVATFTIEGEEVSYEFSVNAIANPLLLPALREFRCPAGL
jgi:type VI secretion system protein ImpL